MGWREEHGDEWAVPKKIEQIEGAYDNSWHNDINPRMTVDVGKKDGPGGTHGSEVNLWVDHPDPEERVYPGRYNVGVNTASPAHADAIARAGIPREDEHGPVWVGDDPDEAIQQLAHTVQNVHQAIRQDAKRGQRKSLNGGQFG